MAGDLSLSISGNMFMGIFGNTRNPTSNLNNLNPYMEQSLYIDVSGADILDISMEAYNSLSYSEHISPMNQDNIEEQLKSMDPALAEKYTAVRQLLSSISPEAARAFDKSLRNILKKTDTPSDQAGSSFHLEAVQKMEVELKLQTDDGDIVNVSISMEGRLSISSGAPQEKDPILIDLNGDGVQFGDMKAFDVDGDSKTELVQWMSETDGALFLDHDGNGRITDIYELFGDTEGYSNGVEKLLAFDENSDSMINSLDSIFSRLMIETGSGKVTSLRDMDVTDILLNGESVILKGENLNYSGGDYNFKYYE